MKRFFVAVVLLCSSFCSVAQQKYKVLVVGTYNCENLFDTEDDSTKNDEDFTPNGSYHYTEDVYRQKLHNIAAVIEKMGTKVSPDGPAVLGLVEIENDKVLKDLAAQPEIARRNYKHLWFPTPDERGISTAMLYNPRYFSVLNAEPVRVPLENLGQRRPTRDILFVTGVLAGDTVHILVNHWPSKSGGEAASAPGRRLAAITSKHIVDSLQQRDPRSKIILLGDLNDNPTSEGVAEVLKTESDKKALELTSIYNPWINMYKQGYGTENYRGEWSLIDQIMLSGAFVKNENNKWQYHNAEIFNDPFITNKIGKDKGLPHRSFTIAHAWDNGYSDHFPVLVYLISK